MSIIDIQNATKVYKLGGESVYALHDLTLSIPSGQFTAIVGPSGSGKSTLLHIVGGLDKPDSGKVIVNSIDLGKQKDRQLANFRNKTVGFIFQDFSLQPRLTALENVELPMIIAGVSPKERREKALKAMTDTDLTDRIKHRPNELSGGQQQRVSIARAIVNSPRIVLADEPTGNLDTRAGGKIIEILRILNKKMGVTVIVVTHDDRVARLADRVIKMQDGKIIQDMKNGKHPRILSRETD